MAGHGRRFIECGYARPKFLLEAHGKSCLEWSVNSLPLQLGDRLIFVGLREHEEAFKMEDRIKARYSDYGLDFVWLDQVTRGQSETVLKVQDGAGQIFP
jgi:CTP:molybdopterin cytidylyltransferase MocA